MQDEKPRISDFPDKRDWLTSVASYHECRLEQWRAIGNLRAVQEEITDYDASVTAGLRLGGRDPYPLIHVAGLIRDNQRRFFLLGAAYALVVEAVPQQLEAEEAAQLCFEAAWLMREMGLIYEQSGDAAGAQRCFTEAAARNQEAGDFAYTHFMSWNLFNEGDAIPIRPRLMEDSKRVQTKSK